MIRWLGAVALCWVPLALVCGASAWHQYVAPRLIVWRHLRALDRARREAVGRRIDIINRMAAKDALQNPTR